MGRDDLAVCLNCKQRLVAGPAHAAEWGADTVAAYCAGCAPAIVRLMANQPERLAARQTLDALDRLNYGPDKLVRWPYPSLDELHGPLAPGNLYFVAAISGGGKTTFLANVIREWDDQRLPLMVMPLEIRPDEWRVWYACVRRHIAPGDALSGLLRARAAAGDPVAIDLRAQIAEELRAMQARADRLVVRSDSHVDLDMLDEAMESAAADGVRVIVVDHVDHLAPAGGGGNPLNDSRRVLHAALASAQRHDLVVVLASQLNLDLARSPDRLAKYASPQVQHLQFPGVKQQVATGIIGLFRPVDDADPELIRKARAGLVEPSLALKPHRMGVTMMKLRHYGQHEGRRAELRLERGVLTDPHVPARVDFTSYPSDIKRAA